MSRGDERAGVDRARRRQRLVWIGLVALVALLLSVFSSGLFLYAVLVVAVTSGLAVVLANVTAAGLRIERRLTRTTLEPGETADVEVTVANRKALPAPWLLCRDHVDAGLDVDGGTGLLRSLAGGEEAHLRYRLTGSRRGLYRVGPAVTEAADPVGLVRRFVVDGAPGFLTVLPRTVPLGGAWPLGHHPVHRTPRRRSLFEDPSLLAGVRAYREGDGMRRIHWRATARTGELLVKSFEPTALRGALLAVDAWPTQPDDLVELAVTAAASIADHVLHEGQSAGLVSNGGDAAEAWPELCGRPDRGRVGNGPRGAGDGPGAGATFHHLEDALEEVGRRREVSGYRPLQVEPGRGSWQRQRLRAALARLVPARGLRLARMLEIEAPRLPRSLVLFVVTPRVDDELCRVLDSLARSGFEVSLLWIRPRAAPVADLPPLPRGIPVHAVADEVELQDLGACAL